MTSEHDRLAATIASARRGVSWQDATQASPELAQHGPSGEPADPLDKQLVKRALFPQRVNPVQIGRFAVQGLVGRGAYRR